MCKVTGTARGRSLASRLDSRYNRLIHARVTNSEVPAGHHSRERAAVLASLLLVPSLDDPHGDYSSGHTEMSRNRVTRGTRVTPGRATEATEATDAACR